MGRRSECLPSIASMASLTSANDGEGGREGGGTSQSDGESE